MKEKLYVHVHECFNNILGARITSMNECTFEMYFFDIMMNIECAFD